MSPLCSLQPGGGEQLRDSLTGIFSQNTGGGQTEPVLGDRYLVTLTAESANHYQLLSSVLLHLGGLRLVISRGF